MHPQSLWCDQYIGVLENLSVERLSELEAVVAPQVEFKDPFNHTHTLEAFVTILSSMYERLDNVQFQVNRSMRQGDEAYIEWTFSGHSKLTGHLCFPGTSYLKAGADGKVIQHFDYWDASLLFEKLPLLGRVIKSLRLKMAD